MTEERMALAELLQKSGDGDFLRSVAEAVLQILMEADVEGLIGAKRHERTGDRFNYRKDYRDRNLDTRLGSLQLGVYDGPMALLPIQKRRFSRPVAEQWYIRPTRLPVRQGGYAPMMSRLNAISPWQLMAIFSGACVARIF